MRGRDANYGLCRGKRSQRQQKQRRILAWVEKVLLKELEEVYQILHY